MHLLGVIVKFDIPENRTGNTTIIYVYDVLEEEGKV